MYDSYKFQIFDKVRIKGKMYTGIVINRFPVFELRLISSLGFVDMGYIVEFPHDCEKLVFEGDLEGLERISLEEITE